MREAKQTKSTLRLYMFGLSTQEFLYSLSIDRRENLHHSEAYYTVLPELSRLALFLLITLERYFRRSPTFS